MVTRTHWIALLAALTGCAGKLDEVVREQAAKDFLCSPKDIDVYDQRSDNYVRDYMATGCGRSAHYQAACSMVDACVAYQPDKLGKDAAASEALTAGIDAIPQPSERVEEIAVAEDGTVTVTNSGAAPPPPPKTPLVAAKEAEVGGAAASTIEVTLRNSCPESVMLWFGPTPGTGEGRLMGLGSTNTATVRVKQGEQLWLLDRERNGTAGITVDASMREVEAGCGGLSAR